MRKDPPHSEQQHPARYKFSMYRVLLIVLLLVLVGLQFRLWISSNGSMAEVHRLKQTKQVLESKVDQAKTRNKALAAEIENLKSGKEAMAGRARSDIGMTKKGETFYFTVEPSDRADTAQSEADDEYDDHGAAAAGK